MVSSIDPLSLYLNIQKLRITLTNKTYGNATLLIPSARELSLQNSVYLNITLTYSPGYNS